MGLIGLIVTVAAGLAGFVIARNFVRRRLRFVDAVHSPGFPFMAGLLAAAVAAVPALLLPIVTGVTAAIFGIGAGVGTASGVKALRRGDG
jgi:hypothetical protein